MGVSVQHEATVEAALARIAANPERFALVLAESRGGACADGRFIDGVADAGGTVPVLFVREPGHVPGLGETPPVCAIEQTPEGPKLLRCALAHARAHPEHQPALAEAVGDRPLVFSYSAPAKKGDR